MTPHCNHCRCFVTDIVDDEAKDDDTDGKRPQAHPQDAAFVRLAQAKIRLPVANNIGSQTKNERRCNKGYKTGPKKLHIFFF